MEKLHDKLNHNFPSKIYAKSQPERQMNLLTKADRETMPSHKSVILFVKLPHYLKIYQDMLCQYHADLGEDRMYL